jgi:hypothetical protein
MSMGRYLERERELGAAIENSQHTSVREFILQKLTATQADDAPVGFASWEGGCRAASHAGPQPC